MFVFNGPVLASKSWLNRALVIQYFNRNLVLDIKSNSDDVASLKRAIESIDQSINQTDQTTHNFDLGLGGTSFRFFCFLISRRPGHWVLNAHERLLQRPQQEVLNILNQLGVTAEFVSGSLHIHSQGWKTVKRISCSGEISSQFISGLLLSCWDLNFDLNIEIRKPIVSYGYLKMTVDLLRAAGLNLLVQEKENSLFYLIAKGQRAQVNYLEPELDMSSTFSLVASALINGEAKITNWNSTSMQPDLDFLNIFKKMDINYDIQDHFFKIEKQNHWKSISYNLNYSPDLFPVLAVLCAFADGVSVLHGVPQLRHKESDRIKKTRELLSLIGTKTEVLPDGLRIYGQTFEEVKKNNSEKIKQDINLSLSFDPDHDHRMAMAAALLKLRGYNITIQHPEVVNKSYPSFWRDIGLTP